MGSTGRLRRVTDRVFKLSPLTVAYSTLIVLLLFTAAPVSAATITIVPDDPVHISINATVRNATAGDTIILNPGTYTENSIVVDRSLTIQANTTYGGTAANTIIDGSNAARIMIVNGGVTVTLDNLTFTRGNAVGGMGGAILNSGTLTVTSSAFSSCSAAYGSAIYSSSSATIASSTFSSCSVTGSGGAILSSGTMTITSSSFTSCSATGDGGAILNTGTLTITSTTFSSCSATNGGAIINYNIMTVTSSAFSSCSASYGGAIDNVGGAIINSITFSRFSGNTAPAGQGPAINNLGTIISGATDNWWGTNGDPSAGFGGFAFPFTPWLMLNATASPASITSARTSLVEANLTFDSAGTDTSGSGHIPDGTTVTFAIVSGSGTLSPAANTTTNGVATTTFTPTACGNAVISATVDSQTVTIPIEMTGCPVTVIDTQAVVPPVTGGSGSDSDDTPAVKDQPVVTTGVNVGGGSAVSHAEVTGTGISDLIVTGTVKGSPGSDIPLPPGILYQYIGLVPARFITIIEAAITFTVPAAWLEEHNIPPENIVLYHYEDGTWVALPTTVSGTENGIVTFTATSPGFSLFAIAGTPYTAGTATAPGVKTIGDLVAESGPAVESTSVPQAPVVTQTTTAPAPAHVQKTGLPVPAIAVAGLVILAAGGFLVRHWWRRKQNPALFEEY